MVYNQKYNFLFIHIQKNAGTAITQALLKIPGSEFIAPAHMRLQDLTFRDDQMPFIFAVIRNPWSRLVSWYEMMMRKGKHNDFSEYLLSCEDTNRFVTFSEYIRRTDVILETANNEVGNTTLDETGSVSWDPGKYEKSLGFNQLDYLTDRAGRFFCHKLIFFENLERDWLALLTRLGMAEHLPLMQKNSNPVAVDYSSYYDNQDDIDWVEKLYKTDIDMFGYSFEGFQQPQFYNSKFKND